MNISLTIILYKLMNNIKFQSFTCVAHLPNLHASHNYDL